jgi:hypothetical protein
MAFKQVFYALREVFPQVLDWLDPQDLCAAQLILFVIIPPPNSSMIRRKNFWDQFL